MVRAVDVKLHPSSPSPFEPDTKKEILGDLAVEWPSPRAPAVPPPLPAPTGSEIESYRADDRFVSDAPGMSGARFVTVGRVRFFFQWVSTQKDRGVEYRLDSGTLNDTSGSEPPLTEAELKTAREEVFVQLVLGIYRTAGADRAPLERAAAERLIRASGVLKELSDAYVTRGARGSIWLPLTVSPDPRHRDI